MTVVSGSSGSSRINRISQDENRQNSDAQKKMSITSVINTNISRPSCFSGLKNQMVNLWHRFIHCITHVSKHTSSITTLSPSFISYVKDGGNDLVENSVVVNKQKEGLYIIKKKNLIKKSNEFLSASKHAEKYLELLLNDAPSALLILATNKELEEKTCDEANETIFFQCKGFQQYGGVNVLSVKTSNTQNIGQLAIDNYNITLGVDKMTTSIPVIHVSNWLDVTHLDENDKENLLDHITKTINNRKKLSTSQSGHENKLSKPKKALFALSFDDNKADAFLKNLV